MEIKVKVKPRLVRASSKESLMNLIIGRYNYCSQTNARAYRPLAYRKSGDEEVRVFNLHKINTKYRQIKYKNSNTKTGAIEGRTRKTELVRKGEWIAYVYDFDLALLRAAGLKVIQGTRNFTIEKVGKR